MMKRKGTVLFFAVFLMMPASMARAGGAAAMRKQQGKMQQQKMIQQRMIQQQMVERQKAIIQQQQIMARQQLEGQPVSVEIQQRIRPPQQAVATATLNEVVASLQESSRDWTLIMDMEAKAAVVNTYIQQYRKKGVAIQGSAYDYAQAIEQMSRESPEMLNLPFADILRIVAIIQYDFRNGEDPDALALKVLGSREAVMQNRQRIGMSAR